MPPPNRNYVDYGPAKVAWEALESTAVSDFLEAGMLKGYLEWRADEKLVRESMLVLYENLRKRFFANWSDHAPENAFDAVIRVLGVMQSNDNVIEACPEIHSTVVAARSKHLQALTQIVQNAKDDHSAQSSPMAEFLSTIPDSNIE